jgi:3-dehydroquinate dehydratase-2
MPLPRVHVLNGPNLDRLGVREPHIYGTQSLSDIERLCRKITDRHGLELIFRQTNAEYQLIEWVQETRFDAGLVLNPAAFCYHSVPLLDALKMLDCPVVEVHISNIHRREAEWRARSILTVAVTGMITGLGAQGYPLALEYLAFLIQGTAAAKQAS